MIEIRRTHPIVKIAFLFQGGEPPDWDCRRHRPYQTSLCPLFWRCVLTIVGVTGFSTLLLEMLAIIAVRLWHVHAATWWLIAKGAGIGVVVALAIYGLISLGLRFKL